jgi:hypothetical protein
VVDHATPITFTSIVNAEWVTVAIPRELITTASMRQRMAASDTIRIFATLQTADLQGDYPEALSRYVTSSMETVQIEVTSNALMVESNTPSMAVVVTPEEAVVLSWLIASETPMSVEQTPVTIDARVMPYYLPPEQFIGSYDSLPDSGNVRVVVFFSADDTSNMSVLTFDAFVNVGAYTHLLADVTYVEMLESLRLHNISYTYTLLPLDNAERQVQTSDDDYVLVVPPPEHALLPCYAPREGGGQAQVVFTIPNYETLPLEGIVNQSGIGILILDVVSLSTDSPACRDNFDISEGFLRLLLSPEDAGIFDILEASGVEYHYTVLPR